MAPRKFSHDIETPWATNDSWRELLTLLTLKQAMARVEKAGTSYPKKGALLKGIDLKELPRWEATIPSSFSPVLVPDCAQELLRGVYWPDDPRCYLFANARGTQPSADSTAWIQEFEGRNLKKGENLIARSHFGNLRFFHAMPASHREQPTTTKRMMLQWARLHVDLATGRLNPHTQIKNLTSPHLSELKILFREHWSWTLKGLLAGGEDRGRSLKDMDVQQRSTGILLHMIQDSFVAGHAERDGGFGAILRFYENSPAPVTLAKNSPLGVGNTLGQYVESKPGAMPAIRVGGKIVCLLDSLVSTDEIMQVLDRGVFRLASEARTDSYIDPDRRKPLVATDFKDLDALKKEIDITYTAGRWIATPRGAGVYIPATVTVSHHRGGQKSSNVLSEATVQQEALKEANKSGLLSKVWIGVNHPEIVVYRGALEAIEKLSFVRKNSAGTAIGKISNVMFDRITNKSPNQALSIGERKLTSHEAIKNMMLHVFGQAIITTLFGRSAADLAGDIHERDQDALISGNISKKEERQAIDNYIDMVNNVYGQELGEELQVLFDITDKTVWTPELTTSYLRAVQDYFQEQMGWRHNKFKVEDAEVSKFTLLLNEVRGHKSAPAVQR